jgi:hypothetical protein
LKKICYLAAFTISIIASCGISKREHEFNCGASPSILALCKLIGFDIQAFFCLTMKQFNFRAFVNGLNEAARSHPIGTLQTIRAELNGLKKRTNKIFTAQGIKDSWAIHDGGRKELQFNIGIDGCRCFRVD